MQNSKLYEYLSLLKLILGIIILVVDYTAINVFEDPIVAIGIGLLGCFLLFWGISFYFFLFTQKIAYNKDINIICADSYKLSFLFGLYSLLNIVLIFLGHWSKIWGLISLVVFIVILYLLSIDITKHAKKSE